MCVQTFTYNPGKPPFATQARLIAPNETAACQAAVPTTAAAAADDADESPPAPPEMELPIMPMAIATKDPIAKPKMRKLRAMVRWLGGGCKDENGVSIILYISGRTDNYIGR